MKKVTGRPSNQAKKTNMFIGQEKVWSQSSLGHISLFWSCLDQSHHRKWYRQNCQWPGLLTLLRRASLICFIAAAFLHESNSSAFFFPLPPSLSWMPLSHNFFSLSYTWFREIFPHFYYHSSLFCVLMRTTLHLASSSRRNFGTRSLNRENSEIARSYPCVVFKTFSLQF